MTKLQLEETLSRKSKKKKKKSKAITIKYNPQRSKSALERKPLNLKLLEQPCAVRTIRSSEERPKLQKPTKTETFATLETKDPSNLKVFHCIIGKPCSF